MFQQQKSYDEKLLFRLRFCSCGRPLPSISPIDRGEDKRKLPAELWPQQPRLSNKQFTKSFFSSKFLILSTCYRCGAGRQKLPLDGAVDFLAPHYNSHFCVSF